MKTLGMLAEFEKPKEILQAAEELKNQGYKKLEAYTPFPVDGLSEILGLKKNPIPLIVLLAGVMGAFTGYLLQYYCNGINYPLNIGGRPLNSIASFIPITFELTILFASIAALLAIFFVNGLPQLWRPIFEVDRFRQASKESFFLLVESTDTHFDEAGTKRILQSLNPRGIYEVPL